jgi:hypothetical protein
MQAQYRGEDRFQSHLPISRSPLQDLQGLNISPNALLGQRIVHQLPMTLMIPITVSPANASGTTACIVHPIGRGASWRWLIKRKQGSRSSLIAVRRELTNVTTVTRQAHHYHHNPTLYIEPDFESDTAIHRN